MFFYCWLCVMAGSADIPDVVISNHIQSFALQGRRKWLKGAVN